MAHADESRVTSKRTRAARLRSWRGASFASLAALLACGFGCGSSADGRQHEPVVAPPSAPKSWRSFVRDAKSAADGDCSVLGTKGNGFAQQVLLAPLAIAQRSKLGAACKQTQAIFRAWQDYLDCVDSGKDAASCAATNAAFLGMCLYVNRRDVKDIDDVVYDAMELPSPWIGPSDPMSGLQTMLQNYCSGEPALKCCNPKGGHGCWSAFNQPGSWPWYGPINCEGNIFYGPVQEAGKAKEVPSGGFTCDHLALCNAPPGGPDPIVLSSDDWSVEDRGNDFFRRVQTSFLDHLSNPHFAPGSCNGPADENAVVIDNTVLGYVSPGYTDSSPSGGAAWSDAIGAGYHGNFRRAANGAGSTADWSFAVTPGKTYAVQATWGAGTLSEGRATNAPYSVYDGDTLVATVRVDQFNRPIGQYVDGAIFQTIATVTSTTGTLRIELTNDANGAVVADAMRIEGPSARTCNPLFTKDEMVGFATFRGCKHWLDVASKDDPYFHADPSLSADTDARASIRHLAMRGAFRILVGLPNGLARLDYLLGRSWSDAQKAAYVATVSDPDAMLSMWLSPLALQLLKDAYTDYRMLAVPLAGETTMDPTGVVDACRLGSSPTVSLTLDRVDTGGTAKITVGATDPDVDANAEGMDPLTVDWGDATVESDLIYSLTDPTINHLTHVYERPGTYTVKAWLTNGSGNAASTSLSVTVVDGSSVAASPAIAAVRLNGVSVLGRGYWEGPITFDVSAIDASSNEQPLAHEFVSMPQRADWIWTYGSAFNTVALDPLVLENRSLSTVTTLRIKPAMFGPVEGSVWLQSIDLFGAADATTPLQTVHPASGDVKVYPPGSATPVAATIDPVSGALMFPANATEIDIPIAPSTSITYPYVFDNNQTGYAESPVDWSYGWPGVGNVQRTSPKKVSVPNTASWTAPVSAGHAYRVQITWGVCYAQLFWGATNAKYGVYDGDTLLRRFSLNQQQLPVGDTIDGTTWVDLGTYTATGSALRVVLSDEATDGFVTADAMRISDMGVAPIPAKPPRLASIVAVDDAGIRVAFANGSAFASPTSWGAGASFGDVATFLGDVDGDAKSDLVAVSSSLGPAVRLSQGVAFAPSATWSTDPFHGSRGTFLGDVDGDGKADLIAIDDSQQRVLLSTGTSFAPVIVTPGAFYGDIVNLAGDFDGDGKTDIVADASWGIWMRLSVGRTFQSPGATLWTPSNFYGQDATLVGDANGDGKDDLISISHGWEVWVLPSTGSTFGAPYRASNVPICGTRKTLLADVDGDGHDDLIAIDDARQRVAFSNGKSFLAPADFGTSSIVGTHATLAGKIQ